MLPNLVKLTLVSQVPSNLVYRTMASGPVTDPIQKMFLDKLRQFVQKASGTPDGLGDVSEKTRKALGEEMERIKRSYGVTKEGDESRINAKFSDVGFTVDSIDQKDWK